MRKQIALGAAVGLGFLLTAAGGCGKTEGSAPVDASADATGLRDAPTQPYYDGSCCGPPEWELGCFDASSVLTFSTPPLPPTANQGKCASDDLIVQFLTSCVARGADAGGDAGETCDAFVAANADCALCLGGSSNPDAGTPPRSPWPALLQIDIAGDVVPAVATCIAAISAGTDTCKSNYANDDLCIESGCGACSVTDFSSCATAQSTDPTTTCLSENPLDHDCQAAISAVSQADADAKCGASTQILTDTEFDDVFTRVAKTLCE